MEFFSFVGILFFIYYLCYILLLCFVDCDLALAFYEYFGKSLSKLSGKVVWITGASSGIGEEMAYEVARNGGKLVLSARRESELNRVKRRCLELNSALSEEHILVLPLDITDLEKHASCFDTTIHYFGQLDILINNAGRSQRAVWEDINIEVDRQIFELNVFGVVNLSRIAIKYFNSRGKGKICVTSSLAGIIGAPFSGSYTGSKHAIHGYFDSLRNEKLESNIHLTLLCPGPVFSNFLQESFTAVPGQKFNEPTNKTDRRMKADRCAKLGLIAIVNKLNESWMALFPVLLFTYGVKYFPNISNSLIRVIGPRRLQRMRDSRPTVSNA